MLLKKIIKCLTCFVTLHHYSFSVENAISKEYAPRVIVASHFLGCIKHCKCIFRLCIESHDESRFTDSMKRWIKQCFTLELMWVCLNFRKEIMQWNIIPMTIPDLIIKKSWNKRTNMEKNELTFTIMTTCHSFIMTRPIMSISFNHNSIFQDLQLSFQEGLRRIQECLQRLWKLQLQSSNSKKMPTFI